jgi:DNA-binding NarL/FixJ family response regulator
MMLSSLLILSDIRFVREGLSEVLGRESAFVIVGASGNLEHACQLATSVATPVVLLDTAFPRGIVAVQTLRKCVTTARIVAFALSETQEEVITWARAGISGYIPRNTPVSEFVERIQSIVRGEQPCGATIASGLLRWIADHAGEYSSLESAAAHSGLTAREQEIVRLIGASLSNKEIARQLNISIATTKSHVHNILAKLRVPRRSLAARTLARQ